MRIKTIFFCLLSLFFVATSMAQTPIHKDLKATRRTGEIKIDGIPDEAGWKDATPMTDLVEFRPTPGAKENEATKTVAYLLYDDEGIYFGGYCYERTKDSIAIELSGRDGFGTNDYVGLVLDTYHDKQNGFEYFVTPLNEQWDAKMSNSGREDFSWDGVWKSKAEIHDNGWSFEMFIPYSAIRFGKKDVQTWGLNFTRRRKKTEQQYTWNPINPTLNGFLTQEGTWSDIQNIKPPFRLQFSPYLSTYVNHYPVNTPGEKNWTSSVNGGMDVKYGINQAFTLDATLVPDFGQVPSDNLVLNLSPFEVRYSENRPFFTEGTELFSKGNLFYPRRIGIDPVLTHSTSDYINSSEVVKKDPIESKLINATKISGRTDKGLGIGILNAITNTRYATLENTNTKEERKVEIDPLTNYSVIVLDQTLKNNSSISLVNTNVWRSGQEYDANVTAGLFSLNDKKNNWNVSGQLTVSNLIGYLPGGKTKTGYNHSVSVGKTSGNFNFNIRQELTNKSFNSNDLGFFTITNFIDHSINMAYTWIKPTNWYNNFRLNANAYYSRRLDPGAYQGANFNINANSQLKNLWGVGAMFGYEPEGNNFYEPRLPGRVFRGWSNYFGNVWIETNNTKKYQAYVEFFYVDRNLFHSKKYQYSFHHRYRFNHKLTISQQINYVPQKYNVGFADIINNDEVIFGRRDIKEVENTFNIKYSFNANMNINARLRHYWSLVTYDKFFTLLQDGSLAANNTYNKNNDQNINFFNIDFVYTWQFAPGSFLNVVWKNAAVDFKQMPIHNYFKNFNNTLQANDNNNISLKVIYFLDYAQLKNLFKNKRN
ncbi:MAG: DUF5916 domain-containing protein [Chitinophagaceae bacterium]